MKPHNSLNTKDTFVTLETSLTTPPRREDVEASFQKTMSAVTKAEPKRILTEPHSEELIISPYFMQLKTKLGLLAGTFIVLLLVGYTTYSRQGPYTDLAGALLEEDIAYEFAPVEDSFADLDEDFRTDPTLEGGEAVSVAPAANGAGAAPAPASANPTPGTTANNSVDVTTDLAAIETLFADDDINDSSLQDWYGDVSATDDLNNQTYDF